MSLSRRSLSMPPAIQRARTAPRKLTSTIRALEPWKYRKLLHQGKNEKNGIAEAIPFLSCPTMFSYREAPFGLFFSLVSGSYLSSRAVASQVLSAYKGLTSVFGMGTGGTPWLNHRNGYGVFSTHLENCIAFQFASIKPSTY